MIGEQIKKHRTQKGLTQQNLADQLFVTAQAVSRWENGEVEPSLNTITQMAKIFGVSTDEMLGIEGAAEKKPEDTPKAEKKKKEPHEKEQGPVLALCERCRRPIFDSDDICFYYTYAGRTRVSHFSCKQCEQKVRAEKKEAARKQAFERRERSYIAGGVGASVLLVLLIIFGAFKSPASILVGILLPIATFTLISCLCLNNNFIGDMIAEITDRSIHMPGVIFSLDLDGIIWFLTVKLALLLLSVLVSIALFLLAITLGLALSIPVYPFALAKSIKHPEKDNDSVESLFD